MHTRLGTIKVSDFWRGFIVAVLTAPLIIIYDTVNAGSLTFDWKKIVGVAIAAAIAYLLKNMATGVNGRLLTNAPGGPGKL